MRPASPLALLLVTLGSFFGARDAQACSCVGGSPACQAYWITDAVFDGTVTSVRRIERTETIGTRQYRIPEYVVRFDVREAWKGVETGPVEILSPDSGGMCGFDFKIGTRYLVFSHRRGTDGRLGVTICSLTREYNGFNNDITPFLASLSAPPPSGGRVFGSVTHSPGPFSTSSTMAPLEVQVRLTGDGRTITTTSTGGEYEFKDVKPARYEIDIAMPEGYSFRGFPRTVDIADPRGCAKENAWATPTGRIAGRVVGPSGPAGSVQVDIALADAKPDARGEVPSVQVRSMPDGTFEASEIPPGRYTVGVNLRGTPTLSNRYGRVIYPGDGSDGEVITMTPGQTADLGTFRIPAPLRAIKVTGTVTWRDGSPAANFPVFAQDLGPDGRRFAGASARSGADGRFTMDLLEGRTYILTTPEFGPRDQVQLDVKPFRAEQSMAPVPVVIPRARRGPSH